MIKTWWDDWWLELDIRATEWRWRLWGAWESLVHGNYPTDKWRAVSLDGEKEWLRLRDDKERE